MIRRPKPTSSHAATLTGAASTAPMAPVPAWLRGTVPDAQNLANNEIADVALTAGAAIAALDAVVRREEKWAGAWRQRPALAAAAVTAKQAGRIEDEAALRDAVLLTKAGDDVGPAGRMALAWRRLATGQAADLLTEINLAVPLEAFGYAPDDEVVSDLADELRQLAANEGMVGVLTGAFAAAERYGLGRAVGAWLADALLAQRLGWTHALPLLGAGVVAGIGTGRPRRPGTTIAAAGIGDEGARAKSLLAAQGRAALRAIDLSAELGRRAERLLAVAPKLRARGADIVVERLLNEDALVASRGEQKNGMSDRALRRLFERLVELGAVRELSGRPTFRIYGL
jgi:hypothetical protein